MIELKHSPTIQDYQEYVAKIEVIRNFSSQSIQDKCILIGEEIGELFKAIRIKEGINIDKNSKKREIAHELVDVFIYLCEIANYYNIDMEEAFRLKEAINSQRTWSV